MDLPDFLQPSSGSAATAAIAGHPTGGSTASGGGLWTAVSGFHVPPQEQTFWCWAAVSHGVGRFYGNRISQCDLAHRVLPGPQNDCCGTDGSGTCNRTWSLDAPLRYLGCYSRREDGALQFPIIETQLQQNQPLGCRIEWFGGGAHFVAIGACSRDPVSGVEYVAVHDPLLPAGSLPVQMPLTEFTQAYNSPGDRWSNSYYTLGATGGAMVSTSSHSPSLDPINA